MKNKNQEKNLKDLILNNREAKERIAMKEIERVVNGFDRDYSGKSKSKYNLWQV